MTLEQIRQAVILFETNIAPSFGRLTGELHTASRRSSRPERTRCDLIGRNLQTLGGKLHAHEKFVRLSRLYVIRIENVPAEVVNETRDTGHNTLRSLQWIKRTTDSFRCAIVGLLPENSSISEDTGGNDASRIKTNSHRAYPAAIPHGLSCQDSLWTACPARPPRVTYMGGYPTARLPNPPLSGWPGDTSLRRRTHFYVRVPQRRRRLPFPSF